eukprot:3799201-Prymnesium_polylepis.1
MWQVRVLPLAAVGGRAGLGRLGGGGPLAREAHAAKRAGARLPRAEAHLVGLRRVRLRRAPRPARARGRLLLGVDGARERAPRHMARRGRPAARAARQAGDSARPLGVSTRGAGARRVARRRRPLAQAAARAARVRAALRRHTRDQGVARLDAPHGTPPLAGGAGGAWRLRERAAHGGRRLPRVGDRHAPHG